MLAKDIYYELEEEKNTLVVYWKKKPYYIERMSHLHNLTILISKQCGISYHIIHNAICDLYNCGFEETTDQISKLQALIDNDLEAANG